jgi:hypothetical protein
MNAAESRTYLDKCLKLLGQFAPAVGRFEEVGVAGLHDDVRLDKLSPRRVRHPCVDMLVHVGCIWSAILLIIARHSLAVSGSSSFKKNRASHCTARRKRRRRLLSSIPTTADSATLGCRNSSLSTSKGPILYPALSMTSSSRPCSNRASVIPILAASFNGRRF